MGLGGVFGAAIPVFWGRTSHFWGRLSHLLGARFTYPQTGASSPALPAKRRGGATLLGSRFRYTMNDIKVL